MPEAASWRYAIWSTNGRAAPWEGSSSCFSHPLQRPDSQRRRSMIENRAIGCDLYVFVYSYAYIYIYIYISSKRFYCRPGAPPTIDCFALDTEHLKPHMDPYPFDDVRGHFVGALWHELAPIRIRSFQLLQESQWGRPWTQSFSLMALHSEGCVLIRQAAHAPVTSALGEVTEVSHRLQTLRY